MGRVRAGMGRSVREGNADRAKRLDGERGRLSKNRERRRRDGELLNLESHLQSLLETFFLQ